MGKTHLLKETLWLDFKKMQQYVDLKKKIHENKRHREVKKWNKSTSGKYQLQKICSRHLNNWQNKERDEEGRCCV